MTCLVTFRTRTRRGLTVGGFLGDGVPPRASAAEPSVELPAQVEAWEKADIYPRIDAYVETMHVDLGDRVHKDQLLATLRAPELQAEHVRRVRLVDQAQADLQVRRAEVATLEAKLVALQAFRDRQRTILQRTEALVSQGALMEDRLDEARFAFESAEANLKSGEADVAAGMAMLGAAEVAVEVARAEQDQAQTMVDYLQIRAPFDGVIAKRLVDAGEYVRPPTSGGVAMLRLVNDQKVRVVAHVSTDDAQRVRIGQRAVVDSLR